MYRCVIIELKLCRTHALFNCDEACLERKDPTYRASVDAEGEQIDAETVKDVLNFVEATTDEGTEMVEVALEMKEGLAVEVGMETEVKQGDPVVQMVRELNRVGRGIREQCKLITDLTYEVESLDCGQYVLEELTGLYQYLYKNGQEQRGLPHLRKRTRAPQAAVQEQAQARILPSTMHRSTLPDQNSEGEAGTSFKV